MAQNREFNPDRALMVFGQNIRKVREKTGIKLNDLARRASYDRVCLSKLEWGEQNMKYNTSVKLARILNVPYPALFSRNFMGVQTEEGFGCSGWFQEDDYLSVFVENFRKSMVKEGIMQRRVCIEQGVAEAVVSRIMKGKDKNPTIKTLYAMAFTSNSELADLFSRLPEQEGLV